MMRINKKLVELGICSRRNADKLIEEGKVIVNGHICVLGEQVEDSDEIEVDGKIIKNDSSKIYIAYNKPKGVICTESNVEKNTKISDIIATWGINKRLFTIGRLDKDSTGLILITNDGDFAKEITSTHKDYEKEYEVRVNKAIDKDFVEKMQNGVYLTELDKTTKQCKIKLFSGDGADYRFKIIIRQGLNRQIRRMCKELGYHVTSLKRIRIINYCLNDLKVGEHIIIDKKEIFDGNRRS